ncbi:hypothetical protein Tco_1302826 [Tanacetum coccineum]
MNHRITIKHFSYNSIQMSQLANDEFSQHLSDEESNHEEASDTDAAPKQQQQVIPQTTAISNIKLPVLEEGEMELQERFQWKGWYCLSTFTVTAAEFQDVTMKGR